MNKWNGKSKSNVIGYKFFIVTLKMFGIPFSYFILKIVSFSYYLFLKKNRIAIEHFYIDALKIPKNKVNKLIIKNFFYFGQTLVDRIAFLIKKENKFTYTFTNEQYLIDIKNSQKGGVLLSGHVGNWETAGNLLKARITSTINILMLDNEEEEIKQYLEETTGGQHFNIIPIKDDLSHIIKIHNALSNNEFVVMHADRYLSSSQFIELDFLGKKAKFPLGPFIVATKFKVPVTFVFAVKENKYHYLLSATKPINENLSAKEVAMLFVSELEKKVIFHPEQWFNYFDFYQ